MTTEQNAERLELQIGHLHFKGELRGMHVHVEVRGIGAEGSRPLLGTLVMAGLEWTSLELVVQLQAEADERHLKDMAEVARADGTLARERAEHLKTAANLERTTEILDLYKTNFTEQGALLSEITKQRDAMQKSLADHQPLRSVIADWDWRGIVADGWQRDCYERAMESAAKAMATVEEALEKSRG